MGPRDDSAHELLSAQARAELLMFAALTVEEGVQLLAAMHAEKVPHGTDRAEEARP